MFNMSIVIKKPEKGSARGRDKKSEPRQRGKLCNLAHHVKLRQAQSSSKERKKQSERPSQRQRSLSVVSTGSARGGGCRCKRSQCNKKYCVCFLDGHACSEDCRCQNCGNTHADGLFNGQYNRHKTNPCKTSVSVGHKSTTSLAGVPIPIYCPQSDLKAIQRRLQ